jgi:hypothetical protein
LNTTIKVFDASERKAIVEVEDRDRRNMAGAEKLAQYSRDLFAEN